MKDRLKDISEKNVYKNSEQINVMVDCLLELYKMVEGLKKAIAKKK